MIGRGRYGIRARRRKELFELNIDFAKSTRSFIYLLSFILPGEKVFFPSFFLSLFPLFPLKDERARIKTPLSEFIKRGVYVSIYRVDG